MKFSSAVAMVLGMAPLALGKAVRNVYPVRRDGHHDKINGIIEKVKAEEHHLNELARLIGLHKPSRTEINFLWVNLGGGAATTVVGTASTVTVTQTVGGDAHATPPPPVVTGHPEAPPPPPPAQPTETVAAPAATHTVTVGGPQGLVFEPQELKAAIGDTVIFTFLSQNHTATQSTFDSPCQALEGGMDSGFQANPNNTIEPPPQVAMQVMVDTPLCTFPIPLRETSKQNLLFLLVFFPLPLPRSRTLTSPDITGFYCRQGNHCGQGMVFSINPTAEKTHAQFQAKAIEQAGDGAGGAITGNPPASSSGAAAAPPAPTETAEVAPPAHTGVATGEGKIGADGSCICAVQCSPDGFPNVALQGRNSYGGFGGEYFFFSQHRRNLT